MDFLLSVLLIIGTIVLAIVVFVIVIILASTVAGFAALIMMLLFASEHWIMSGILAVSLIIYFTKMRDKDVVKKLFKFTSRSKELESETPS